METEEYREENLVVREFHANGVSIKTTDVEAKLDEGNIQEAESSLREGLSLNFEEARALLGKLEYQRGNVEGALRVFDGIDLRAAIQRLQPSLTEKMPSKKGRPRADSLHGVSQHAANLVLEAIYLKAKSLQKLGKLTEAAHECKNVLDAVEKIFYLGIPDVQVDNRLQETVSQAVELLPELWKRGGCYQEAVSAYRRALLSQWNLDNDCTARIQKEFAVFLLYGGVEASSPSLAVQVEGSYIPKNNMEEAILLLMILMKKTFLGVICEGSGRIPEAVAAYINAVLFEPDYVPCKILISALFTKTGSKSLPIVKCLLSDALRIDPTNKKAWYYLGIIHRDEGRTTDAIDCFQAAAMVEEFDPIQSFASLL